MKRQHTVQGSAPKRNIELTKQPQPSDLFLHDLKTGEFIVKGSFPKNFLPPRGLNPYPNNVFRY